MEGLTIEMTVRLRKDCCANKLFLGSALMANINLLCDAVWIDDKPVVLDGYYKEETKTLKHKYKYQFKKGENAVPSDAFSNLDILAITFSEGWKKLKNNCFRSCNFECDLILPDSIQRICSDAFHSSKVTGEFRLPAGLKCLSSLPETEESKNEIVLPEGLVSFIYPNKLRLDSLTLPSTLKEIRINAYPVWVGPENDIKSVIISPDNKYLSLKNNMIISILADKRRKMNKLEQVRLDSYMEIELKEEGLHYNCHWNPPSLSIQIHGGHSAIFPKKEWSKRGDIVKLREIAKRLKALFAEYNNLCNLITFDRWYIKGLHANEVLLKKNISYSLNLNEYNGGDLAFSVDLHSMGYPVVKEAEDFFVKLKEVMTELHVQFGHFSMEIN